MLLPLLPLPALAPTLWTSPQRTPNLIPPSWLLASRSGPDTHDLTLTHGRLYSRLLKAAEAQAIAEVRAAADARRDCGPFVPEFRAACRWVWDTAAAAAAQLPWARAARKPVRPVRLHLVWKPHKLLPAYPWRLRMYAFLALVMPRRWVEAGGGGLSVSVHDSCDIEGRDR